MTFNFNFKNMLIVSLVLLTVCISLGGVSASDANTDLSYIDGSATIGVANVDIGSNGISSENFNKESNSLGKTFDDIQKMIDNAEEKDIIKLNGNYSANGKFININKPLTIDGNGATLDGKNITQFFYINGNNIIGNNNLGSFNIINIEFLSSGCRIVKRSSSLACKVDVQPFFQSSPTIDIGNRRTV